MLLDADSASPSTTQQKPATDRRRRLRTLDQGKHLRGERMFAVRHSIGDQVLTSETVRHQIIAIQRGIVRVNAKSCCRSFNTFL